MSKKKSLFSDPSLKAIIVVLIIGAVFVFSTVWIIRAWYGASLKPVSTSTQTVEFTVQPGSSVSLIATNLQKDKLIRSAKAFETYVRSNPFDRNLQAGTYQLSPSMSIRSIVHKMAVGDVVKKLLTILPDKRLDQVKQAFIAAGYTQTEVDQAFSPANYKGHPALVSLPQGASLEGYLYPDSFDKGINTPATAIISQSLDEMNKHLNADILQGFTAQGLNTYQGITLASIVNQETDDPVYQPTVAQVFLSRLKKGMNLGSDVTAFYASAVAGKPKNLTIDSPYNTRTHTGLPPGPIGNVTASALAAVAHPNNTDYLFFVAGDDKKIHFTHTQAEHDAAVAQFCKTQCR